MLSRSFSLGDGDSNESPADSPALETGGRRRRERAWIAAEAAALAAVLAAWLVRAYAAQALGAAALLAGWGVVRRRQAGAAAVGLVETGAAAYVSSHVWREGLAEDWWWIGVAVIGFMAAHRAWEALFAL